MKCNHNNQILNLLLFLPLTNIYKLEPSTEVQEQEAVIKEREEAEVNGEIAVDGGHYLIGETLKPGMCRTD
jgi:hypothetical protein